MKSNHLSSNISYAGKGDRDEAAVNRLSEEVVLGDLIWVWLRDSSWWPAQVVDDNAVSQSNRPKNRSVGEVLVRLYGSYKYIYVDPMTSRSSFENVLKQNNGNYSEIFKNALEQDLACSKSVRAKEKGSKFKGKVRVGSPRDKKAKENITKKNQEIEYPISSRASRYQANVTQRMLAANTSPPKVNDRNSLSEKTGEARSSKRKQGEMQRKIEPNSPTSTRISPRTLAGGKVQNVVKNGNSLSAKTEEMKSKKQKHDAMQKKLEPNSPNSATTSAGKSQELTARRMKVMQSLALVAPSGSPFH